MAECSSLCRPSEGIHRFPSSARFFAGTDHEVTPASLVGLHMHPKADGPWARYCGPLEGEIEIIECTPRTPDLDVLDRFPDPIWFVSRIVTADDRG